MLKELSVATRSWKKVRSVTVDMPKISHVMRIYAAKAVTKPVVAHVCQEETAGWVNCFHFFLFVFCIAYVVHIYMYKCKKHGSRKLWINEI